MTAIRLSGWLLGVAANLLFGLNPGQAQSGPNILFCISDDQSYAHAGANGDPIVQTPAFDRVGITQTLMEAGKPLTIFMKAAPKSQTLSFFIFGIGDTGNIGGLPLAPTTCSVFANPMISAPFPINSQGEASMSFSLPLSAKGVTAFMQGWSFAAGANPLNLTVASAVCCVVQ